MSAPLPPDAAYRLWAPVYDEENALTRLDSLAASWCLADCGDLRVLDAACGTGRRLVFEPDDAPSFACGVDRSFEMLAAGRRAGRPGPFVRGDLLAPPLRGVFDAVSCRLAAGHVSALDALYASLARLLVSGGVLFVTDLHPAAAGAGHARTFRDADGAAHAVAHVVHDLAAHDLAAARAGLRFDARLELFAEGPDGRNGPVHLSLRFRKP